MVRFVTDISLLSLSVALSVWTVEGKDMTNKEQLIKGIWSAISSKQVSPVHLDQIIVLTLLSCWSVCQMQYGNEEFIANLVADACLTVMPKDKGTFAVDNVRVV